MIDIHSHIMFGVDDGCKTVDESIMMIKAAVDSGITDLFLTPHYRPTKKYVASCEEIEEKFNILKDKIVKLNIPIKLYLGREIDEVDNMFEYIKKGKFTTMNNSNYILVDFGVRSCDISEVVYEAGLHGYRVIIAHIERYSYITSMKTFETLKRQGALFQVNASSMISPRNIEIKRKIKYLRKNNMIDFIASDAHRNSNSFTKYESIMNQNKNEKINRCIF